MRQREYAFAAKFYRYGWTDSSDRKSDVANKTFARISNPLGFSVISGAAIRATPLHLSAVSSNAFKTAAVALYYGGLGMTVYSVGTAFVGTDAETSSAQMLLTAASASSTADETKTDAAINYAAVDKGQTYRIDGALNSGMTVITKAGATMATTFLSVRNVFKTSMI